MTDPKDVAQISTILSEWQNCWNRWLKTGNKDEGLLGWDRFRCKNSVIVNNGVVVDQVGFDTQRQSAIAYVENLRKSGVVKLGSSELTFKSLGNTSMLVTQKTTIQQK
eukprot:UN02598